MRKVMEELRKQSLHSLVESTRADASGAAVNVASSDVDLDAASSGAAVNVAASDVDLDAASSDVDLGVDAIVDFEMETSCCFSTFLEHGEGFMCTSGHINPPVCCQLCASESNRKLVHKIKELERKEIHSLPLPMPRPLPTSKRGLRRRLARMRNLLIKIHKACLNGDWKVLGSCFTDEEVEVILEIHPKLKEKLMKETVAKLKESIDPVDVVRVCDQGISRRVYSNLVHLARLSEVLPSGYQIQKKKRQMLNETISEFKPLFTKDGVDLDPASVVIWIVQKYKLQNHDEICLSWDARLIKKGGVERIRFPDSSLLYSKESWSSTFARSLLSSMYLLGKGC
jgi:hypothetical protein